MAENKEVLMLKLTLKPGEFINIGEDVRVVFSGGSANNIHLLIDAPKNIAIARIMRKEGSVLPKVATILPFTPFSL